MTSSFMEQLEETMAALAEQQTRMAEAAAELRAATASATSKDRMVTAKVGPHGEVLGLTFHSTAYQTMAPAQLSAVLTDVLNEARARMGDRVARSMRGFEGVGESLRVSLTGDEGEVFGAGGGLDLDTLLAPLTAMRPGDPATAKGRSAKQAEFDG